jgi:hypothetical protein
VIAHFSLDLTEGVWWSRLKGESLMVENDGSLGGFEGSFIGREARYLKVSSSFRSTHKRNWKQTNHFVNLSVSFMIG